MTIEDIANLAAVEALKKRRAYKKEINDVTTKQLHTRAIILFALAAIVYFSLHKSQRSPHQDPW